MSIYDIKIKDQTNKEISMSDYKGKVLLIVNTATGCGFTPQYVGLQKLYEKYNSKGFEILDFPCNQFANQAPGTNQEINQFCIARFSIKFKQFAKIDVNGKNASDLYKYLKINKKGLLGGTIKWNFTKFLIDRDGEIIDRFAPNITPEEIDSHIAKLL